MNVIAPKIIRVFIEQYPNAESVMREWYNALRKTDFPNFAALKESFSSVDTARNSVDDTVHVFDVGGNKYRVVCFINYQNQTAFIKHVFTHMDYDHWNRMGRPA
jgi:mRNA interferase HigB